MNLRRKLFEDCWCEGHTLSMGVAVEHLGPDHNIPEDVVADWDDQAVLPLDFDNSWPMDVEYTEEAITADIAFRRHTGVIVARCKIPWSSIAYITTVFETEKPKRRTSGRTRSNSQGTTLRLV